MGKAMSVAGLVVGGLVAVMFALDLFLGAMSDIGMAICGAIVAYLGWNAFRDVK